MKPLIGVVLAGGLAWGVTAAFEPMQPDVLSASGAFVNAFADYDSDDDLDLFVGLNGPANRLYRNDGGRFAEVAVDAGIADARPTRAVAWADVDADGDPDLLVGFAPGPSTGESVLRLYRNTKGRFSDVTAATGLSVEGGAVRQPAFVDIDADGDLDLFVAFRDRANAFFRNDGGRFAEVAAQIGLADTRRSVGAVWFDFDEDGDLDLVVGEMDGDPNAMYRNDGGRFTDVAGETGIAWGGRAARDPANGTVRPCAGDVNNDGRIDLFFANYGRNGLFLNRGPGRFEDVSRTWGVDADARYDTCAFADFDNDGRLDLYVNGTVTGGVSYPDALLRNAGRSFAPATPQNLAALNADHGAQWADVDGDGDEDLALTGVGKDAMPLLFRNLLDVSSARRSIRVRVVDRRGRATLAGAEVRVYGAEGGHLIGTRLVDAGSGYNSQNDMAVQLAWTGDSRVNVEVIYPANGRRIKTLRRNHDPRSRRTVIVHVSGAAPLH
jgi:FG-GAP-like repeat